jgi:cytochrome c oxidase assembly protein subunit 15
MGDEWIPSEIMDITPWYNNFHQNTATVQFNHRILGMSTAAGAITLAAIGLSPSKAGLLTPQVRKGLYAIGLASAGQVTLGITTLLYYVPISLAAAHQIGSIVVLTSGVYLTHSLRYVRPAVFRMARGAAEKSSSAGKQVADAAVA